MSVFAYGSLFVCTLFSGTLSYFTDDFANFLEDNYGETFRDLLQRRDLGEKGSFGGRSADNEEITRDPVVFVHGVSDTAGEKMKILASRFIGAGYQEAELYGTTYSGGSLNNPVQWTQYSMRCEYVKQVRALILAVRYYTRRNVDVISFSLGVPIARKAILGGFCVDTDDDLGGPLTKYVDTFVGIAGPNHGISLRVAGITVPACLLGTPPICDRIVGLYSGICPIESLFLNDINRKEHYEGSHVFSVFSQVDQLVGYRVCDKITSSIPGEDGHKSYSHLSHDELLTNSAELLLKAVQNHTTDTFIRRAASIPNDTDLVDHTDLSEVKNIFEDTKLTPMSSIRKYFRDQRQEAKDDLDSVDVKIREIGVEKIQSPSDSPSAVINWKSEQKATGEIDAKTTLFDNRPPAEIIPFMESRKTVEGGAYHTKIHLKIEP